MKNIILFKAPANNKIVIVLSGFFLIMTLIFFSYSCQNQPPVFPVNKTLLADTTYTITVDSISVIKADYKLGEGLFLYAGEYDSIEASIFFRLPELSNFPDTSEIQILSVTFEFITQSQYYQPRDSLYMEEEKLIPDNFTYPANPGKEEYFLVKLSLVTGYTEDWEESSPGDSLMQADFQEVGRAYLRRETSFSAYNVPLPDSLLFHWLFDESFSRNLRLDVRGFSGDLIQKIYSSESSYIPFLKVKYLRRKDEKQLLYNKYIRKDITCVQDGRRLPSGLMAFSPVLENQLRLTFQFPVQNQNYYVHRAYLNLYQDNLHNRFYEKTFPLRASFFQDDSSTKTIVEKNISNLKSYIRLDVTPFFQSYVNGRIDKEEILLRSSELIDQLSWFVISVSDTNRPYIEVMLIDEYPQD